MSSPAPIATFFTNFFGGAGYFFAGINWFWVIIAWLPTLISSHSIDWVLPSGKPKAQPVTPVGDITIPPAIALIIGFVVTVIILGITVYILYKLPAEAIKKSSEIAHMTSEKAVPFVTHHRQIKVEEKTVLSGRLLFYLKLLAAAAPIGIAAILVFGSFNSELPPSIVLFIASGASAVSVICFTAQLGLARAFGTAADKLL